MKKFAKFVDKQAQKLVLSIEQHNFQSPSQPYSTVQDPTQYENTQYPPPPSLPSHTTYQSYPPTYPTPQSTPQHNPSNTIPPAYSPYTNQYQTHPNSVPTPPIQSTPHNNLSHPPSSPPTNTNTPPSGYPVFHNKPSVPPPPSQQNQSIPSIPPIYSPPSAYNLPQSVGTNHSPSKPSTPTQPSIPNHTAYSTTAILPFHPNVSSASVTPQFHPYYPPGNPSPVNPYPVHPPPVHPPPANPPSANNPHYPQYTSHQPQSHPPHLAVQPPNLNPVHVQPIPDHIIYGKKLLDNETIQQAKTRIHSARVALGDIATMDARKGLSRPIQTGNPNDIELFGDQLKNSQIDACELNYKNFVDKILCIAVSYVQCEHPIGRFKFSAEQWNSLKVVLANLFYCGVTEVRLWLDQCLWIRDVGQESWAHTGLIPYVLWPVVSLGVKRFQHDRTTESYRRMWPFVEELAGLWSMGLMITKEMRSENAESGSRSELSYNLRHRLEPEKSMELILMNIYHGAADGHETGWKEDVEELKEMARLNISSEIEGIAIGSDWRSKIARGEPKELDEIIDGLQLSHHAEFEDTINAYVEGSRCIVKGNEAGWDGVLEWTSGNKGLTSHTTFDYSMDVEDMKQFNILTDQCEFQILGKEGFAAGIWLLVAMDGFSSRFSRGRVAWTKVISGENSCHLSEALKNNKTWVVENVLREQTNYVHSITKMECVDDLPIEWT